MRLSAEQSSYIENITLSLYRGDPIQGVRYNSSYISGPGVTDEFDPDVIMTPKVGAGYWPGGVLDGRDYIMTTINGAPDENPNDERIFMRKLILEGSLGAAALQRYEEGQAKMPELARLKQQQGPMLVPNILQYCSEVSAPFAYLVVGNVHKSQSISEGERLAALFYPNGVPPKTALANIRKTVRRMEEEEVL